ncbi:MAG TPA: hypothetical protein ENH87_21655 [Pricia antarctica]|uniref:tRNA_anti-like n=2 Tax=root TaxID=1 RepID=A0A831QV30_9FLAO|nr:hypothetical protein [Pricia antarctica]
MNNRFKIAIIGLLALLASCLYLYFEFNRLPEDIFTADTDVKITSRTLAKSFKTNETRANAEFVEKTIEVVGSIEEITNINNRYTLLLQGRSKANYVICDLSASELEEVKKLQLGQTVRIKGICAGYLMDVIMLNCIIING